MDPRHSPAERSASIGVVVIGRNEGERLRRCLHSVSKSAVRVYVDSASTDESVEMARGMGVAVVELSTPPKLTAARGRNAGFEQLAAAHPEIAYVQMVDGDCEMQPGWFEAARAALEADPGLAAVFGRRRERFPERSVYNALCDDEWNVPVGNALVCGGDVMCRVDALGSIGGYDPDLIAGEDPDMATRLRGAGWRIERIDAEMTLHDAAILQFGQWWRRARRAGHAVAELAYRHRGMRAPNWRRRCFSIVAWGGLLPLLVLATLIAALALSPLWLIATIGLVLVWPLQMIRLALARRDLPPRIAAARGVLLMAGKFPELLGLSQFHLGRLSGRQSRLIEYKGAGGPS